MDLTTVAAIVFAVVTGGTVAFQIALALGAPWGSYTMGGKFPGRLPPTMRVAAVIQGLILGLLGAVVVSRAGVALAPWMPMSVWLTWAVVAFCGVSFVLNSITPSAEERRVWAPATLVLLASSLTVALTAE